MIMLKLLQKALVTSVEVMVRKLEIRKGEGFWSFVEL